MVEESKICKLQKIQKHLKQADKKNGLQINYIFPILKLYESPYSKVFKGCITFSTLGGDNFKIGMFRTSAICPPAVILHLSCSWRERKGGYENYVNYMHLKDGN